MSSRGSSCSRLILGATLLLLACKDTTAPRVPGTMSARSAVTQAARAGTAVAESPAVLVLDQDAQPLGGVTVAFAVTAGGGTVTGSPATTDDAGVARLASWTLGSDGTTNVVRATVGSMSTDFEATALVAASLEIVSTQSQQAKAGTQVPTAPAVRVLDQNGQPLPGVTVSFAVITGGGTVSGASATTDASGIARLASWTLGSDGTTNVVRATVGSMST
ncbi:MAG TPA: Ig-like domain-containing protein, partial [Gemmatimonadaceae bacterium]|nr:Ig-like domain-containing protein [Gemmatimonadaceae bacterium]